jgi:hypothetical protein
MKGGIFNRPECCNQPCECPVCLENKPLMRLNCNHYVCLEDIQYIINSKPRRLQKCPICRVLITNYGCNGNITNVPNNQQLNNQQPNIIPYEEGETVGEETHDDTYVAPNVNANGYNIVSDDEDEIYGGKKKTNRTRKNKKIKLNKIKKTNRRRKISKRKINKKRKTKRSAF